MNMSAVTSVGFHMIGYIVMVCMRHNSHKEEFKKDRELSSRMWN
jgi:hypothetical protein